MELRKPIFSAEDEPILAFLENVLEATKSKRLAWNPGERSLACDLEKDYSLLMTE